MAKVIVNRPLRIGPSPAGHVYTKESLEGIVSNWKHTGNAIFGMIERDPNNKYIDADKVVSKVIDMHVDDEGLVVEQLILETPAGEKFLEFIDYVEAYPNLVQFQIRPIVGGMVNIDNEVEGAKLITIDILTDPDNPDYE